MLVSNALFSGTMETDVRPDERAIRTNSNTATHSEWEGKREGGREERREGGEGTKGGTSWDVGLVTT